MLHPRTSWHQAKVAPGESLAMAMGQSVQRKAQVADMLEPRSNFSVAVLDDRLMVMGGYR